MIWLYRKFLRWSLRREAEMDREFLIPALERAAERQGCSGAEKDEAVARALILHDSLQEKNQ